MPQTIRYHSDLKTVQVPQTPNTYTRKHKQPSLPSSQPPPHYCAKPHGECTSLLQNKYSFLKGQISQWKTTYPNSSCTCQLNIIKIPYTRKCFIPSLQRNLNVPLPPERFWLSWMLSFVIRKFQSTTAIRQGRFLFISHTPPPPARHSREPRLAKHTGVRYFAGAGAGAPRGLCQRPAPLCPPGDSSRTTLAQHRARPRWRGTRPARLGEPPAGPGPPPASLAGTRPGSGSGRLLLPPPEGRPGQPQGSLPSPPLPRRCRRPHPPGAAPRRPARRGARSGAGAGAGREAGSGSGAAGASFPLAGQGRALPVTAPGIQHPASRAAAPPSRQAPAHRRTLAKVLQAAGSGPPPPARRSPAPARGARAPPPAARGRGPARRPLRRRGSAPPAQPLPPRPARTSGRAAKGARPPPPASAAEALAALRCRRPRPPAARDQAVRLPPRGESYREVSPQIWCKAAPKTATILCLISK